MEDFKLPDGWRAHAPCYGNDGFLLLSLSYRDEAVYSVLWDTGDVVTQSGYSTAGRPLAYDPTVTALALCWLAQHHMTPRYPRDVAQHN